MVTKDTHAVLFTGIYTLSYICATRPSVSDDWSPLTNDIPCNHSFCFKYLTLLKSVGNKIKVIYTVTRKIGAQPLHVHCILCMSWHI